jgi:hypothetical protein
MRLIDAKHLIRVREDFLFSELESKSNLNIFNKKTMVKVRKVFISQLISDLNALVAALINLPKGAKLIFSDSLHDTCSARLEAVLGQQEASQL